MVELLVAMAIIGLLIATAIWGIGVAQQSARNTQRREAGAQILAGFSEYYARYNSQPRGIAFSANGACICDTRLLAETCDLSTKCYSVKLNGIVNPAMTYGAGSSTPVPGAGYSLSATINGTNWAILGTASTASQTQWRIHNASTVGGTKICVQLEGGGYANLSEPQSITCQ